jgi:hypothetical protein
MASDTRLFGLLIEEIRSKLGKNERRVLMSFRTWSVRVLQQVRGVNPFDGDCLPTRVSLFGFGRPTLPFPHLWNYKNPIKIFATFYWDAEKETGRENITAIYTWRDYPPYS